MAERDLIIGVLAVQAGFATPAQVMAATSACLREKERGPLNALLEAAGALTPTRRKLLDAKVDEVLAAHGGNESRALESLGGVAAVSRTFTASLPAGVAGDSGRVLFEERLGQYTRLDELGRGGQSVVYRAVDESIGREVALKQMVAAPPEAPESPSVAAARARFLREARLTAQLDHPPKTRVVTA